MRVPTNQNVFSSVAAWRRRAVSRAVHRVARWMRQAAAVTAERPGPYRFRRIGAGTRLAYPQGTVFGDPWIEIGEHCIIAQDVTLTAGMMPDLDLGPAPILTLGNGVVLGRGSHVIADVRLTIGDDCFFGPGVYVTTTNHSYGDPDVPVGKQWPRTDPVSIGPGSWIGTGAVILPGARLGRNVVVAAGAVVRGAVPDHAVVAAHPPGSSAAGTGRRAGSRRCVRRPRCRCPRGSPPSSCSRSPSTRRPGRRTGHSRTARRRTRRRAVPERPSAGRRHPRSRRPHAVQ